MPALTLTQSIEQTVAAVVERLLAQYRLLRDEMGERPLGYQQGNKWERLDAYLDYRSDPLAWQNMLAWQTQRFSGNTAAAVAEVMREATALERSLALEGGWDRTPEDYPRAVQMGAVRVKSEMFARRMTPALRAQREVEKQAALPAPLVGPEIVLPPMTPPMFTLAPPIGEPSFPAVGQPMVQSFAPPAGVPL